MNDDWGKPPGWFWPLWVLSALLGLGFLGLVVWVLIQAGQWLSANT